VWIFKSPRSQPIPAEQKPAILSSPKTLSEKLNYEKFLYKDAWDSVEAAIGLFTGYFPFI